MNSKLFILLNIISGLSVVYGVALMSLDIGSEWMKIGVVSPGVPMEIALNKESKRKTLVSVAFRNNERYFGEEALNVGLRFPKMHYVYLLDLLGKKVEHPSVKEYIKRFPHYEIFPHPETGTVVFKHDENTNYTPEELLAMIIAYARDLAETFAGQVIKDCVITVPPYFGQPERRAMLLSASMAGVKVLQLINVNTAVALNYGIFRRGDFNVTSQNIMFFDMGASSTIATIVSYQTVKTKERGITETHPQLSILGVGFDRSLGGVTIQTRLQSHLAQAFNDQKKSSKSVFDNHRAMSKLLREAGRVKNILSANSDYTSQVEGLMDEIDFKHHVTRDTLESMCSDLYDRIEPVIKVALAQAEMSYSALDQLILVGAGTRAPKVQEILSKVTGMELGKSINTDEAAAMGAVYKAADLGTGFKVKKFITKDAVLFPIQVDFERELTAEESSTEQKKLVRRTLFGPLNLYPQKKLMGFNRHVKDFLFYINYGELSHLYEKEIQFMGSMNLTEVDVKGVEECLSKESGEGVERKGIKAHFLYDESGLLSLTHAECVFEKTVVEGSADQAKEGEESTLSKLGNKISSFFSGGEEEPKKGDVQKDEKEQSSQEGEKPEKAESTDKDNSTTSTEKDKKEAPSVPKTKVITVKYPLSFISTPMDIKNFSDTHVQEFIAKMRKLDEDDRLRREREQSVNSLESAVLEIRERLSEDEYISGTSQAEKDSLLEKCAQISDWMDEEGYEAPTATFKEKLKEVEKLTKDIYDRVKEHRDRPKAMAALDGILNGSSVFLLQARNLTEEQQYFSAVELETLEKLITNTKKWKEEKLKEQEAIALYDPVKLTVMSIAEKINALDREVKYLVNKAKTTKAKRDREAAQKKLDELKLNLTSGLNLTDELPIKAEEDSSKTESGQPDERTGETKEEIPDVDELPNLEVDSISKDVPVGEEEGETKKEEL